MTPDLDLDLAFSHHLLAVDADVAQDEVAALALSWFPRAAVLGDHAILLADEAVLTGPWAVSGSDRAALRLPAGGTQVYLLRCPVQRGGPPPPELVAPAGLSGAFRSGMPFGLEAEAVTFLLAAAGRLGGALRVAGSGSVLAPDPDAEVNLWIYSPVRLEPDALVDAVAPVLPSFRLAIEPGGPAAAEPQAQPPARTAYGAVAELGDDGLIEVTVEGEDVVPLVLQGLDWVEAGAVAYAVRWWPTDPAAQYVPDPPEAFRAARARVRGQVERAVRALHAAVGGEITDESGFLVDPASLA